MKDYDYGQVEDLASKGMSQNAIAKELGIGASTFTLHLNKRKEVREAYERGKLKRYSNETPEPEFDHKVFKESLLKIGEPETRIYVAVNAGYHRYTTLREVTEIPGNVLYNALDSLIKKGQIVTVEKGIREEYYTGDQYKELLNSKVTHVEPTNGNLVSDSRLAHTVESVKKEKNITPTPLTKNDAISNDSPENCSEKMHALTKAYSQDFKERNGLEVSNGLAVIKHTQIEQIEPAINSPQPAINNPDFLQKVLDARAYLEEKHRRDVAAIERTIEIIKEMENE